MAGRRLEVGRKWEKRKYFDEGDRCGGGGWGVDSISQAGAREAAWESQ